ncbi:MAG: hypothetical protein RIG63_03750 [Coleofasciculus chthonoplastes F3-SA18-01]|jgi:rhodanese-related sulfurtransferase|uniref:Rhodanese domain-containing protein n=1 Tax=Coleofasciculus chthonoplastes PCC 7420 TaxID=118168 RepID=B4VR45_9CYAN|nr:hypothetical protein [Coleofasciculus chthonoplastes]EDX75385.1 hypothetical protein MC7420_1303 [Coleofasciculus chthonoplastes PCC 7420]
MALVLEQINTEGLDGFDQVINIPGSWSAWKTADLPVQQSA